MFIGIYCLILLWVLFTHKIFKLKNPKKSFLVGTCVLFVLCAFFRDSSIGVDTSTYELMFYYIKDGVQTSFSDIGWYYYIKAIQIFSQDFKMYLFVTAIITYGGILIFIYYNSKNYIVSALLFMAVFYLNSLNIARQYMAIAIACNFFTAEKLEKKRLSLILCLIGASLHMSAALYLGLWIFYKIKNKKFRNGLTIIIVLLIACMLYSKDFLTYVIVHTPYARILFDSVHMKSVETGGRMAYFYGICAFGGVVAYCFYKKKFEERNEYNYILSIVIFGFVLSLLGNKYELLSRVALYCNIFVLLILPYITDTIFKKRDRIIVNGLLMILMGIFLNLTSFEYISWLGEINV